MAAKKAIRTVVVTVIVTVVMMMMMMIILMIVLVKLNMNKETNSGAISKQAFLFRYQKSYHH